MSKIFRKSIAILLAVTFITGQSFAAPVSKEYSTSTLAPTVQPPETKAEIIEALSPIAIGQGQALNALRAAVVSGILPERADIDNDALLGMVSEKIVPAITLALTLFEQNGVNVQPGIYSEIAQAEMARLENLDDNLPSKIYPFEAIVNGKEDFLLEFPADRFEGDAEVGIAVDLIDWLYNERYASDPTTALWRTAQIIAHSRIPEDALIKNGMLSVEDRRTLYTKIHGKIFGENEVEALGQDLRAFINTKLGLDDIPPPTPFSSFVAIRSNGLPEDVTTTDGLSLTGEPLQDPDENEDDGKSMAKGEHVGREFISEEIEHWEKTPINDIGQYSKLMEEAIAYWMDHNPQVGAFLQNAFNERKIQVIDVDTRGRNTPSPWLLYLRGYKRMRYTVIYTYNKNMLIPRELLNIFLNPKQMESELIDFIGPSYHKTIFAGKSL